MAWLSGWNKRVKITLSNTNVDDTLSNFPVLVYLSTSSGTGSTDVSCIFDELTSDANRFKIAVTTSDGETECYVEIERWDDANEKAWLWVKVPSVVASAVTELYIYYDSAHADNTAKVGDIGSTPGHNVWDANFKAVYHMRDATTSTIKDSTSGSHDGTKVGANEPIEATGKVDKGQDFDGDNDKITVADHADFDFSGAFTLEAIVKPNSNLVQHRYVYRYDPTSTDGYFTGGYYTLTPYKHCFGVYVGGESKFVFSNEAIDTANYVHIGCTRDASGNMTMILDGASQSDTDVLSGAIDSSDPLYLGIDRVGAHTLDGILDEIRVSNTNRSAAWLKATKHSLWDNIASYGTEETTGGEDVSFSEAFSMSDTVEVTWSAQGVIEEAFSSDDYVSLPIDVIIEEAFSSNDSVLGGKVFSVTIEEAFNSDDVILVNWNAQEIIAEALSLNDDISVNWNAICDVMEELSLDDYFWASASNVYGRFRKPVNLAGNRISLKIQNNSLDQVLWLQDLGLLLFGREEYFENNKPVNLKSQHIQLKIQNNTLSETLHLFDVGLRLTGYDQR